MKKLMIAEIISALLIFLFIYSSVSKLLDYSTFRVQLSKSPFIADKAGSIAASLLIAELATAVCLLLPRYRKLGLYTSLFLLTLFTGYIIIILNFSYYIPCSCGGVLQQLTWKQHIIFNSVFIVLSIIAILFNTKKFTLINQP